MKSLALLAVILYASLCIAETINVNPNGTADYQTIQQAINNANNGDTVIVAPATYYENVDFIGKAITVTSSDPEDWAVVESTIINANDVNSAVIFTNSEGPASIITGFTITGGVGTAVTGNISSHLGAGICCFQTSPTITKNIITGNTGLSSTTGGGIGGFGSNAVVTRNIIKQNSGLHGGGVLNWSGNMKIRNNIVYDNTAGNIGGGILLYENGELINNTIADNSASSSINIYASGDFTISNNIIYRNAATGGSGVSFAAPDDYIFSYNNVWNYCDDPYEGIQGQANIKGNIAIDPLFVNESIDDFHLQATSPCINAGDPNFIAGVDERDIDGNARVSSSRVDIGADELATNIAPIADAGPDQLIPHVPATVTLDGSGSTDFEGDTITYSWLQTAGPTVSLSNANIVNPTFNPSQFGIYTFGLTVNDGTNDSLANTVIITIANTIPIADAGAYQSFEQIPVSVTLDGSNSYDVDGDSIIAYSWQQTTGATVTLSNPNAAITTFAPVEFDAYSFELVVSDEFGDSITDVTAVTIGNGNPIADAGSSRYACVNDVDLDGSKSYDPDTSGTLSYSWSQIVGPTTVIINGNTATPTISGFVPTTEVQVCQYELIVSDGTYNSLPKTTEVIIVPDFRPVQMHAYDYFDFDPNKPTFINFGGGTGCGSNVHGSGTWPVSTWGPLANLVYYTQQVAPGNGWHADPGSYPGTCKNLANELLVYFSSKAPDYKQNIQTSGFSAGGIPAAYVAVYLNTTYNDPRYAVNRITFLDALTDPVCGEANFDFNGHIEMFLDNPVAGEQCWVDNYLGRCCTSVSHTHPSTLNVRIGDGHTQCMEGYRDSITFPKMNQYNDGVVACHYVSVAGPAKNLQLARPDDIGYDFRWSVDEYVNGYIYLDDPTNNPGIIPEPVTLVGPADGTLVDGNGLILSSQVSQNVIGYQLLVGVDEYRVMDYILISDTPNPPTEVVTLFPAEKTWWTVRAYDQYGSTIYADPNWIVAENVTPATNLVTNSTQNRTYQSIQQAIDEAVDGDVIVLSASAYPYVESIDLAGKAITLKSQDPTDPAVVASTIIRGSDYAPVAAFTNGEDANTLLDGLTITGGTAGILCDASSPTISNCTITDNADAAIDLRNNSKPMLINCTIDGLIANHLVENITKGQTYGSIQQAIDDANDNDQIVVYPSVYRENIDFAGKNLTLRSTDPLDSDNTAGTVIKALDPMIPTVTFINAENANCTLAGFTITEGYSGIYCDGSQPTISNCIITGNSAENGGGIRCDNGAAPRIDGCLISENYATDWGGGVCRSFAEISNSVIINNRAEFSGGGIYVHSAPITNCLIAGNYPEGIDLSRNSTLVQITNCTIVENYAQGLDMGKPVFRNCIVAGNDEAGTNVQISGSFANVEYCLVEDGFAGTGNIDNDPCFATPGSWADVNTWNQGDYHLKSEFGRWDPAIKAWTIDAVTSAAIDAGDANSLWQDEKWPHGAQVNLGVYGNTVEASMSGSQAGNLADANNDQNVNLWDFAELAFNWNETAKCVYADLNADAAVNEFDLKILTDNWLWVESE
jgi:parallel beta-helix repeat protein